MMNSSLSPADNALKLFEKFLSSTPVRPLIVLIGPTASGKTALSIDLALSLQQRGFAPEIINADSRQLYRFLDIGTAKITREEMRGIPHHLLSVLDPREDVSISWFQNEVQKLITDIYSRGAIPMLVGGSMLYVSAIVDALQPMRVDPELRERLSREYDIDDGRSLHARLASVDPESAIAIPRENKVYVLRALEVYESTGIPKSKQSTRTESPYDTLIICLDPPRDVLDARISERTRQMFESGWADEVRGLMARGCSEKDPAMMSHGYREILQKIREGTIDESILELIEDIASKGRRYAKRHRTWWKGDSRVHFLR